MTACRLRTAAVVAAAAGLLVACGAATGSGEAASGPIGPSAASGTTAPGEISADAEPAELLDDLLAARFAGDPQRFAALVSQAAASCADRDVSRSLGQLSGVAARWADSVALARPKAQARAEAQLAEVDWADLISACGST